MGYLGNDPNRQALTTEDIADGTITNADVNSSAAIAHSKLAALADGNILVGNGSNVATSVNPSGDVDVSNAGVFSIASDVIVNDDVKSDAAIAYSKLAALADGNILVGNGSNVATSVNPSGAVDISNAGVFSIANDAIDSVHYAAGSIDTEHIANDQITNALMADDAIGVAELSATGTASSGTYLRGDNSWAAAYSDAEAITAVENEATLVLAGDVSVAADKAISLANEGKVKFTDTTFGDGDQRSSGITLRFTTDNLAVAIGQAVHLSGTGVILADADVASQGAIPCIGVAASATAGSGTENIDVLVLGCMRYDTYDFTVGSDVFVTATPGGLDETAPSSTGHYVQKVGIAMSADILYVNPSLDVIEHA